MYVYIKLCACESRCRHRLAVYVRVLYGTRIVMIIIALAIFNAWKRVMVAAIMAARIMRNLDIPTYIERFECTSEKLRIHIYNTSSL